MGRVVPHVEKEKGKTCSCGARFKTPVELRRHLRNKQAREPQRV